MAVITVIVPVYRAELYLERCVSSVLRQRFQELELILVDDGSPDGCPALCDAYAAADPRVHVIHQPNSGPSAARNNAIAWALARSEAGYFAFVDSDDCLHPQYLERLYAAAETAGADIAMCRHKFFRDPEELEPLVLYEAPVSAKPRSPEELVVQESKSFNYCWGKLFRKTLFRSLRFPEQVRFGEDNLTIYKAFFAAEKIIFFPETSYYYFYNPNSITKSAWSPGSLDCLLGVREQLAFYQEHGYPRAYAKEQELYVSLLAHQIHRIRGDRQHLRQNRPYLRKLSAEMRAALKSFPSGELFRHSYWLEALHPRLGQLRLLFLRIRRHLPRVRRKA